MLVKITFYGYPDNDDGAGNFHTAIIAHRLDWLGRRRYVDENGLPFAGGSGTFDDPITAAASRGNRFFPPGTLVYIPDFQKYFFLEDECASCDEEPWLDLWLESNSTSDPDVVEARESALTGDETRPREVIIDPPPDLGVDPLSFLEADSMSVE